MKKISIISSLALSAITSVSLAQETATEESKPAIQSPTTETETKKTATLTKEEIRKEISYALGHQSGLQYAARGIIASDIDQEAFMKGLLDTFGGEQRTSTPENFEQAMQSFSQSVREREQALAESNIEFNKKFFAENAKKEGIISTPSGLQYKVLTKGSALKYSVPEGTTGQDNRTEFHIAYKIYNLAGELILQSPTEKPEVQTLQVIQGLQEVFKIIPVGATWEIYLPSDLAFGARRMDSNIGPNTGLRYELELKKITLRPAPLNAPQAPIKP